MTTTCCRQDETPVLVNKDGRDAGSKSYIWVYRTGEMYGDCPIILYEYQKTRNASHPREFLRISAVFVLRTVTRYTTRSKMSVRT